MHVCKSFQLIFCCEKVDRVEFRFNIVGSLGQNSRAYVPPWLLGRSIPPKQGGYRELKDPSPKSSQLNSTFADSSSRRGTGWFVFLSLPFSTSLKTFQLILFCSVLFVSCVYVVDAHALFSE